MNFRKFLHLPQNFSNAETNEPCGRTSQLLWDPVLDICLWQPKILLHQVPPCSPAVLWWQPLCYVTSHIFAFNIKVVLTVTCKNRIPSVALWLKFSQCRNSGRFMSICNSIFEYPSYKSSIDILKWMHIGIKCNIFLMQL